MDQGGHGAPKILNFWPKKKKNFGNLVHPYDQWPSLKNLKKKKITFT